MRQSSPGPLALAFALVITSAGCGDGAATTPDAAADLHRPFSDLYPESPDGGAVVPTKAHALIAIVATNGNGGELTTVRLADQKVTPAGAKPLSGPARVRCEAGSCWVVDRAAGEVRLFAAGDFTKATVFSVGKDEPRDVVALPASKKVYVSLYRADAAHAVAVLDRTMPQAGIVKSIALPQAGADSDGSPEADRLHFCGGFAYVTLADLDRASGQPTGPGRIAAIDAATDVPAGTIQLAGRIPVALAPDGAGCDTVLVAQAGSLSNFELTPDGTGGLERVDVTLRKSYGLWLKDTALKGRPRSLSIRGGRARVVVRMSDGGERSDDVAGIDLATGTLGWSLALADDIAFGVESPDGKSRWLGVRGGTAGGDRFGVGLYVATTMPFQFTSPIDLGLAPNDIAFY